MHKLSTMSQLRVRNIFQLVLSVPAQAPQSIELVSRLLTSGDEFGFAVIDSISKDTYEYKVHLYNVKTGENQTAVPHCLCWAKRNPISLQADKDSQSIISIIMRMKVQQGYFDFRKLDGGQSVRLVVDCFHEGTLLRQASSNIVKLLPKKRKGKFDSEGT